jgi:cytoskeletal protein RodZ
MDGRRGSPGRNTGLVRFVVLVLGVLVIGLLLGFLLGRIGGNREEAAPPPAPRARTVTVEKTVAGPEKTIEKTIPAPEKTVRETPSPTSASASASP